ncbi:conserved hypothetical protein [Streptomyces pristinaespiralis ATCC 25486]|uniref:Uncharacterized protein n=1 Tax=Streptomyces pristinaespiralis (strain ATCC 25486 / DSM 40338 / CBS 914.69 / JCM 4507 / KCC S-0507 / NBRC 13074 / NRRL 2958 / 5647) TaxID=457429 RepID=B5H9B7_STRE2|nr:conserved hypothetical protein [Streptomyces pristinaespiralis ATCC 25486]
MQDRTGVRRAADVEAAPDDQLGMVAPDVHMRSPSVLTVPRVGPVSTVRLTVLRFFSVLQQLTAA